MEESNKFNRNSQTTLLWESGSFKHQMEFVAFNINGTGNQMQPFME